MTAKPDSNRIQKLLKNFTKEKFVGMSGLALLCGATVFALSGDPGAALLGSVGSNVLAAVLQQHFEKVRDLPNADEQERLAVFARSLTPEISNNKELQEAVGAFVDANHTFDIALALVDENPEVHGWLLTKIYGEVRAYRQDFDLIHGKLDHMMLRLEKLNANPENEIALQPYLAMVARRSEMLPLASLDPSGGEQTEVTLAEVFVSLRVGTGIRVSEKELEGQTWFGFSDAALAHIHTQKQLILLGDAGSGKSTLLRYLMYCLAQARMNPEMETLTRLSWVIEFFEREPFDNPPHPAPDIVSMARRRLGRDKTPKPIKDSWQNGLPIPILVELRQFAATSFEADSPQAIWQYIEDVLIQDGAAAVLPALRKQAEYGNLLFLLDGVDEISTDKREDVWRAIAALRHGIYGGNRWIATCRVFSFVASEAPKRVPVQTLRPLTQEQIDNFITNWQSALLERGQLNQQEAKRFAEDLREATRGRLNELAPNPMLLTIIVLVQKFHGVLPKERAKLYKACVEIMLLRWQQHKEKGRGKKSLTILSQLKLEGGDLEKMLWEIAWVAHSKNPATTGTADISQSDLLQVVQQQKYFGDDLERAGIFVNYTKERAHLLIFKGSNPEPIYTFPHRTFQEFLAARYLLTNRKERKGIAELASMGAPWREVLNLAVGYRVFEEKDDEAAIELIGGVMTNKIPAVADLNGWHRVWLAGEMAAIMEPHRLQEVEGGSEILVVLSEQLVALLTSGVLTPQQRAEAGEALAVLGEQRPDIVCDVPEMVDVPAGPFLMGSNNKKDEQAYEDETPQHEVMLPAYRIGKYPVTNAQFALFTQAGGYENKTYWTEAGWAERRKQRWTEPRHSDNSRYNQANQPVAGVSWYEAVAYCNWLKVTTGRNFRLPDEAMWEKAARGTQGQIYPWGDEWDETRLNMSDTNINRPSAVGIFPAGKSPYGAYDMCGNVLEWCSTVWGEYPFEERPYRAEIEADDNRCLRGGAFDYNQWFSRAAFRNGNDPVNRDDDIGFRVAEHLSISGS